MKKQEITVEKVQEFFDFLSEGLVSDKISMTNRPKLGPNKAFNVIWYLQEHLRILPDNFEICAECKRIIDTDSEGYYSEKLFKHFCNGCYDNRIFRGQRT